MAHASPRTTSPPASQDVALPHVILTLIRHGETTANLARLLQGVADSPLTVFGQAQVDALAAAFATTLLRAATAGEPRGAPSPSKRPRLDLPPPSLVVCSPVGRARKTAEAVYRACGGAGDAETLETDPARSTAEAGSERSALLNGCHRSPACQEGLRLIIDPGLAERDFGPFESTRNRVHVPGFERGKGKGEDKLSFRNRVQTVGRDWLEAAASLAAAAPTVAPPEEDDASTRSTPRPPHVVLVSHGMWISSFLTLFPPTTIRQHPGQPDFLPFAHNTGIFSLAIESKAATTGVDQQVPRQSGRVRTTLIKANDVAHLTNVKRQRGGIGRVAHDERQTKLQGFFAPKPRAAAADVEARAANKRQRTDGGDG